MAQRNDHARRVLELAGAEAERFGHRYLGPEHLVLGMLADGGSEASRVLEAHGVDLPAARAALGRLADRGVVPGPRPSDAELLGTLGIDLAAIRRTTEQTFGNRAVGWAIREATRALGIGVIGPELLLLGVVTDIQTPWSRCMNNRWRRQLYASVGLLEGYRGARRAAAGGFRCRPRPARRGPAGRAWGGRALAGGRGDLADA